MKQVKIRITNFSKNEIKEYWYPVNSGSDLHLNDESTPMMRIEIMEISCDEEHPVKHHTWGYDG